MEKVIPEGGTGAGSILWTVDRECKKRKRISIMNGLKPIKIPSAKEKVAAELRKAILSRKMKEGESLSLESVAEQLNV